MKPKEYTKKDCLRIAAMFMREYEHGHLTLDKEIAEKFLRLSASPSELSKYNKFIRKPC